MYNGLPVLSDRLFLDDNLLRRDHPVPSPFLNGIRSLGFCQTFLAHLFLVPTIDILDISVYDEGVNKKNHLLRNMLELLAGLTVITNLNQSTFSVSFLEVVPVELRIEAENAPSASLDKDCKKPHRGSGRRCD